MKITLPFFLVVLLLLACSKENIEQKPLTYENFNTSLKEDMDYDAIVELFGAPDESSGSGIARLIYNLEDSTIIEIGYTGKISYANHLDKNHNLLHAILP